MSCSFPKLQVTILCRRCSNLDFTENKVARKTTHLLCMSIFSDFSTLSELSDHPDHASLLGTERRVTVVYVMSMNISEESACRLDLYGSMP